MQRLLSVLFSILTPRLKAADVLRVGIEPLHCGVERAAERTTHMRGYFIGVDCRNLLIERVKNLPGIGILFCGHGRHG